jgi:hypothetical protein
MDKFKKVKTGFDNRQLAYFRQSQLGFLPILKTSTQI